MPIIIKSSYTKKLGLPGYSSHSYSLTVETELSDISQLDRQSAQLYATLQSSVDRELQETGFCPDGNGNGSPAPSTTNAHATDQPRSNGHSSQSDREWRCSPKQRNLVLSIIEQNKLDKRDVEKLSQELFNAPVLTLDKMQMSGLIENLLQTYGDAKGSNGNGRQYQRGGSRR